MLKKYTLQILLFLATLLATSSQATQFVKENNAQKTNNDSHIQPYYHYTLGQRKKRIENTVEIDDLADEKDNLSGNYIVGKLKDKKGAIYLTVITSNNKNNELHKFFFINRDPTIETDVIKKVKTLFHCHVITHTNPSLSPHIIFQLLGWLAQEQKKYTPIFIHTNVPICVNCSAIVSSFFNLHIQSNPKGCHFSSINLANICPLAQQYIKSELTLPLAKKLLFSAGPLQAQKQPFANAKEQPQQNVAAQDAQIAKILREKAALQKEKSNLQDKYNSLQQQYNILSAKLNKAKKEKTNLQSSFGYIAEDNIRQKEKQDELFSKQTKHTIPKQYNFAQAEAEKNRLEAAYNKKTAELEEWYQSEKSKVKEKYQQKTQKATETYEKETAEIHSIFKGKDDRLKKKYREKFGMLHGRHRVDEMNMYTNNEKKYIKTDKTFLEEIKSLKEKYLGKSAKHKEAYRKALPQFLENLCKHSSNSNDKELYKKWLDQLKQYEKEGNNGGIQRLSEEIFRKSEKINANREHSNFLTEFERAQEERNLNLRLKSEETKLGEEIDQELKKIHKKREEDEKEAQKELDEACSKAENERDDDYKRLKQRYKAEKNKLERAYMASVNKLHKHQSSTDQNEVFDID